MQITGIDELFRKLDALTAVGRLKTPMQRAVIRLQARMAVYPPPPPNSRYRRTGTLGRRWTTEIQEFPDGVTGKVGNDTIYGPLVQSSKLQTATHKRTGWQTDAQVVEQESVAIVADFEKAIADALR